MSSTIEEPPTSERQRLRCFIIGPIGNRFAETGSDELERYEEAIQVLETVILPACQAVGLAPVRADGLAQAGEITEQIFRRLRYDDVVIADLTDANPNVMYELGLRHTRNALTVQIGEYGRLPFDVTVIRTVQFSRSTFGLITARNELTAMLEAGLSGDYDMVTATRVWNEQSIPEIPPTEDNEHDVEVEPPGFMDLIADSEENQGPLLEAIQAVGERVAELGHEAEAATQRMAASDAQGAGMRGRLAVAIQFAEKMNRVAGQLESDVNKYEAAMRSVSAGNVALIQHLEEDPAQLPDVMDLGRLLRQMAARTRQAIELQQGFVANMNVAARATQVLRAPTRRISHTLDRFASASQVVDEWDRRLQALGVDVPPEDWQYPDSDELNHS